MPPPKISGPISIPTSGDRVPAPVVDHAAVALRDYQLLFASQRTETAKPVALRVVDGAIPPDFPSGTYYLAGPGIFSDDHGSTVHPLDGHGYLRAFTIDGLTRAVKYSARYVKTEAQREEHDPVTGTWRFTHRGPFSVLRGARMVGNTKVMKNVANTSVVRWGGRLMCLWEGGAPYEIESETLGTVGRFDVTNGCDSGQCGRGKVDAYHVAARLLNPILSGIFKMPPKRLLSHYKIDAHENRLLMLSCNAEDMLLPCSHFIFYEFDSNFKLLQRKEFCIPDHMMIHDWAFTKTHYILFGNRVKLDISGSLKAVCGLSPMISTLSVNPSKPTSPIYLLPRFAVQERDWREPIEAPSQLWLLHVGNAFHEINENDGHARIQIFASACSYQWFNFPKMFGYNWHNGKLDPSTMNAKEGETKLLPHIVQVLINLDPEGNCQNCIVEPLNQWSKPSDFPAINPLFSGNKNTYIYVASASGSHPTLPHFPFDTIVKLNVVNKSTFAWSVGARRFIGEPTFVPIGPKEDDGYLLVVEYAVSIQRCYLLILNPRRIGESNAIVARIEVPRYLSFPIGFHGFWAVEDNISQPHLN
ncbi:carotenoid cleavage dioxygenase 7, chloroplastic [Malania oleifera]|uniref:carotenoid cleavage dioxygenase 7, chloroplastic n=1 Tax=Malania oleifera TaxID=397392 RepID=UPI0025ADEAAB|nr:carotenoid cleavage dioxygenase 7, chloroplastic [Malania oleifera]